MPSGITVEKDCFIIFEKQIRRVVSTQQRGIALLMIGRDASIAAHPYKTKNKHHIYVPLPHHPKIAALCHPAPFDGSGATTIHSHETGIA